MNIAPVSLFEHFHHYLVPGQTSVVRLVVPCPKLSCLVGSTRLFNVFSLHLTFRIFYNPGRQLDAVVVILLNGKIRD